MMRRRFPLVDVINLNILRLHQTGIISKMFRDVHRNSSKFEVPKKVETRGQKKLTIEDLKMIVYLLIVGHSVASIVFLAELIIWNVKRKANR